MTGFSILVNIGKITTIVVPATGNTNATILFLITYRSYSSSGNRDLNNNNSKSTKSTKFNKKVLLKKENQ